MPATPCDASGQLRGRAYAAIRLHQGYPASRQTGRDHPQQVVNQVNLRHRPRLLMIATPRQRDTSPPVGQTDHHHAQMVRQFGFVHQQDHPAFCPVSQHPAHPRRAASLNVHPLVPDEPLQAALNTIGFAQHTQPFSHHTQPATSRFYNPGAQRRQIQPLPFLQWQIFHNLLVQPIYYALTHRTSPSVSLSELEVSDESPDFQTVAPKSVVLPTPTWGEGSGVREPLAPFHVGWLNQDRQRGTNGDVHKTLLG